MGVVRFAALIVLLMISAAAVGYGVLRASDHAWSLWLEHWTGDKRTALFAYRPETQHPNIALVTITHETMAAYPYRLPINRSLLAALVTALDNAGARTIGLDFLFLKSTEPRRDDELVAAIKASNTPVVVAAADKRVALKPRFYGYQKEFLAKTGAVPGYANLQTGGDNIVRYVSPPSDPMFPVSFARALVVPQAKSEDVVGRRRIAWSGLPKDGNERFFAIPAHVLLSPTGSLTPVAPALLGRFKDKIVIIGGDFVDVDRHETPMQAWQSHEDVAGMTIHAQVAAQMLDGRAIVHLARPYLLALFIALAFFAAWFGVRHGFLAYSLYASAASIMVVCGDIVLYRFSQTIIPFGGCLLALVLGVLCGLLLRRFRHLFG